MNFVVLIADFFHLFSFWFSHDLASGEIIFKSIVSWSNLLPFLTLKPHISFLESVSPTSTSSDISVQRSQVHQWLVTV